LTILSYNFHPADVEESVFQHIDHLRLRNIN
jgi:hypothetical protein